MPEQMPFFNHMGWLCLACSSPTKVGQLYPVPIQLKLAKLNLLLSNLSWPILDFRVPLPKKTFAENAD